MLKFVSTNQYVWTVWGWSIIYSILSVRRYLLWFVVWGLFGWYLAFYFRLTKVKICFFETSLPLIIFLLYSCWIYFTAVFWLYLSVSDQMASTLHSYEVFRQNTRRIIHVSRLHTKSMKRWNSCHSIGKNWTQAKISWHWRSHWGHEVNNADV